MKIKTKNVTNNGKLPIGAYFGPFPKDPRWPDDPDVLNNESYKLARDGGFNFMIGFAERYRFSRRYFQDARYAERNDEYPYFPYVSASFFFGYLLP